MTVGYRVPAIVAVTTAMAAGGAGGLSSLNQPFEITAAGTYNIRTAGAIQVYVTINTPSSGAADTLKVYNNPSGTTNEIANIAVGTGGIGTLLYDCAMSTGITVVYTGSGGNFTIVTTPTS